MDRQARDRLRRKQDLIIAYATKRGILDTEIFTYRWQGPVTIGDLKRFIFPDLEGFIDDYIREELIPMGWNIKSLPRYKREGLLPHYKPEKEGLANG